MKKLLKPFDYKNLAIKVVPYFILALLSLAALYVYFYEGLLQGDDIVFHLANISDEYLSLLNEGSISRISTYLASGLGVGVRLFYSPLFHILAGIIYFITNGLGGNAITAIEVIMFISVFVSGVFMYRFLFKVTNNQIAATLAAALYILYPYRIFDALCRAAYAEALAFAFIPLFFHGLYGLVNFKEEIKVGPFIATIIGGASLFLSHNLTAMFGFIFGVIYLLANGGKIAVLLKRRRYWITGLISIVLLVGLMGIQLFPTAELLNTGLYNISNRTRMWTTLVHVLNRIDTAFNYSGFLNFPYMNSANPLTMNASMMVTQIISFLFLSVLFIVIDKSLARIAKLKYFHFVISAAAYIGLVILFSLRIEVIFGAVVILILYFFIDYLNFQQKTNIGEQHRTPIYAEIDFWFLIGIIILTFILITQKWIWRIMPDPLLMIQFPWRLWAFIQFFLSWMVGWLCFRLKNTKVMAVGATVAIGLCLVTNQALPEKRLLYDKIYEGTSTSTIYDGNGNYLAFSSSTGWNKEYYPQVFLQDDYVPEHANSLYYDVRLTIKTNFNESYPFDPVVLEGNATIDVALQETPNYELNIEVTDASLIQMPLIYYPGYRIEVLNQQGNTARKEAFNIDGLIAFNVDVGESAVKISYVGTPVAIFANVFFIISLVGTIGLGFFYVFILDKKFIKRAK